MDRRTPTPQDPARRNPPVDGGPDPLPRPDQETPGRPFLSVGPAFARTLRHFFPDFNRWLDQAPDARRPERVEYHPRFLLWYALLLFVGKLGSRLQLDFKYPQRGTAVLENVNRLAQTEQDAAPHNDTLDDY